MCLNKPLIYITRKIPTKILEPYTSQFEFKMWNEEEIPVPREVLSEEVKDIDGLLCLLTEKIDEDLLKNAPKLKLSRIHLMY